MADREQRAVAAGIDGLHRQRVAAAITGNLAGQDDVDAFTHGNQPGPGFIELSVGPEPGNGPLRIQPRVGEMNGAPSSAIASACSSDPWNTACPVPFRKSAIRRESGARGGGGAGGPP